MFEVQRFQHFQLQRQSELMKPYLHNNNDNDDNDDNDDGDNNNNW